MNDNLPPLPEPALVIGTKLLPYEERCFSTQDLAVRLGYREGIRSYYTTAQVEEIRRAAILQERARCAKVCEEIENAAWKEWKATYKTYDEGRSDGAGECAAAIRDGA